MKTRFVLAASLLVVALGACRSDPPDSDDNNTAATNNRPVANPATVNTAFGANVSGQLTGSDADGDPLTFALSTNASNGTVSVSDTGGFAYSPNAGFSGTDTFGFRVNDGTEDSDQAIVMVSVAAAPANNPPVAQDQSATTDFQTQLTGTVTATDADGDALTYRLFSQAPNGTAVVNAGGSFTYNPDTGFSGTDSFTFRANDGQVDSNTATVTITVNPAANRAPTATDQSFSTPANTQLADTLAASDPDGDMLTYAVDTNPGNGTLVLNANGSFTYDPNGGFSGIDSFTFTVNDGTVTSAAGTVTIDVGNVAPVVNDQTFTGDEDALLTATIAASDANTTDTLTYSAQTQPSNGELRSFNTSTGEFTYLPARDFEGSDSFTVQVTDGRGGSDTATITLTIACPIPTGECDFDKLPLVDDATFSGAREPALIVQTPAPALPDVTRPYVAYTEEANAGQRNLFVRRFNAGAWEIVDDAGDANDTVDRAGDAAAPDLVPSTVLPLTVVLAWDEGGDIFVDRYSDLQPTWQNNSGNPNQGNARGATLAISTLSQPLVAFVENANTANSDAVAYSNTGLSVPLPGAWQQLDQNDGALDNVNSNSVGTVAIANDDLVGVGSGPIGGRPIIAFSEVQGGVSQIFVKRCPDSGNTTATCPQLGPSLNVNAAVNAQNPSAAVASFAVDLNVRPVVAFDEGGDVYVRRYVEASNTWVTLGGGPVDIVAGDAASNPSLAVDLLGRIVVAWQEIDSASGVSRIYMKRYDDVSGVFVQLGNILNCDIDQNATAPDVAFDTLFRPYVAFEEEVTSGGTTDTRIVVLRYTEQ